MHAHSVANLFPMMGNDEYAALVADIHQHGQREPIWLLDGQIIDGRNRWQACRDLGIQPITRDYTGPADMSSLIAFVVSLNLKRRHLTDSQKATVGVNIKQQMQVTNPPGRPTVTENGGNISTIPAAKNRDFAGSIVGVSGRYIDEAERVQRQAPDLFENVRTGTITLPEAKKLAQLPEYDRATIIDRVAAGDAKTVTKALAELRLENKRAAAMSQPSGVYNVLYADPPWEYDNTGVHGAADHHYPTMPLDAISSLLDDQRISIADNAVLFLWATNPFLQDAFYVINSWGFEYKTNAVWVKTDLVKPGSGFYVRGRHELLLICTRGSFTPLDPHISPPIGSVVSAPVQEHSQKPSTFYDIIERLYPGCTYLELFARTAREGWERWGYDSPR